ncbi:MAG: DNA polymerase IV [Nitrosomonas sp.]|nr:MAG: DNA polymerase IV [Nitrosomonas sp.]
MDAFYASVELLRYPELRGLPVVIGGRGEHAPILNADGTWRFCRLSGYAGRGVVTTATYEARAKGVFSAMGMMKAAQLAPEAILLPTDFPRYRHYSRLFKAAVAGIAPHIEDTGIDEIYIDLTQLPGETPVLAGRIKQAVRDATGLSCSIGVSPNKLLSKICSDLEKPDGLTIIGVDDISARIWPLPVQKINGIGPKAAQKLAALGIRRIAELACTDLALLYTHFGRSYAAWLYDVARGIDHRPVVVNAEPKSISRETTFERDLHPQYDRADLSAAFVALCTQVAKDLTRKGYAGRTVSIKLRFADFHTVTRDFSMTEYTADAAVIRQAARECLRRVPLRKRIRLLGVKVSALCTLHLLYGSAAYRQQELPLVF